MLPAALLATCYAPAYDAHIKVSSAKAQTVAAARAGLVSLDNYMRLPVVQYTAIPLPLQAKLLKTARSDEFEMRVPPLAFAVPGLPITVAPTVLATVRSEQDRVLIRSDRCTLSGSPEAERLIDATRLNERFSFNVRAELTWDSAPSRAVIRSRTAVEVDVDTPRIFKLVPMPVLEAIVTRATRVVLEALLEVFLRNLAADYARWATDSGYRESRAALSSAAPRPIAAAQ